MPPIRGHPDVSIRQSSTTLDQRTLDYSHPIATALSSHRRGSQYLSPYKYPGCTPVIASVPCYLSPFPLAPSSHLLFLSYPHLLSMKTCAKNKSKHPAAPVMTPAQLAAAGISQPQKCPRRKQTKDQQIAALEEDLRTTRELLQAVSTSAIFVFFRVIDFFQSHPTPSQTAPSQMVLESPNEDDDTEPATEDDDYMFAGGRKRVSQKPAGAGKKCVNRFFRLELWTG